MKVEPSGIVMIGECEVQTKVCVAIDPAPITAVWELPNRKQVNVCKRCLEEMIRNGDWEVKGAKITKQVDLAVYDARHNLQLIVEVKKHPSNPHVDHWAMRVHDNLIIHSGLPSANYFLLATYPRPFFLWAGDDIFKLGSPPAYSIDVENQLDVFRYQIDPRLEEFQFQEEIVCLWLSEIINSDRLAENGWLRESGLAQAIQGGSILRSKRYSEKAA